LSYSLLHNTTQHTDNFRRPY